MGRVQSILIACTIEIGAFSGERVFRLPLADEKTEYSGVAPVHYCYNPSKSPLGRDGPSEGTPIEGFVEALLITNKGDYATVELPDGETIDVSPSRVLRRNVSREIAYVPL